MTSVMTEERCNRSLQSRTEKQTGDIIMLEPYPRFIVTMQTAFSLIHMEADTINPFTV